MKLVNFFNRFRKDESGAVTVDWVVLTAAIVGLGIAVLTSVSSGTTGLADKISTELTNTEIMQHGGAGAEAPAEEPVEG